MKHTALITMFIGALVLGCESQGAAPFDRNTGGGTGGGTTGGDDTGGDTGGGGGITDLEWSMVATEGGMALEIRWPSAAGSGVQTLVIEQHSNEVRFDAAEGTSVVRIPVGSESAEQQLLEAGNANYRIEVGGSSVTNGNLILTERFTDSFFQNIPDPATFYGLPTSVKVADQIEISGSGPNGLRGKVYIGRPTGRVDVIELAADPGPNETFVVPYTIFDEGVYAIEIVATNGLPAAVVPMYCVGGPVPLVVPVLDQWPPDDLTTEPIDLNHIHSALLGLTNDARQKSGVTALSNNNALDETALIKAQQIEAYGQLVHSSADGSVENVGTIAGAKGMSGNFSENIGVEVNPERVFAGWWWSPTHRRPLLDTKWKSIGSSAEMFDPNYNHVVFVQHFSDKYPGQ